MRPRLPTTVLAAIAAIGSTAAIALAAAGGGPEAHAASKFFVYTYNAIERFHAAGVHSVTAHCAQGKTLTGGGVTQHGTRAGDVIKSAPDGEGWTASVRVAPSTFVDMQVQVYAICGVSVG